MLGFGMVTADGAVRKGDQLALLTLELVARNLLKFATLYQAVAALKDSIKNVGDLYHSEEGAARWSVSFEVLQLPADPVCPLGWCISCGRVRINLSANRPESASFSLPTNPQSKALPSFRKPSML